MRYFLICDNSDTYVGLRMAGVEGIVTHSKSETEAQIEAAVRDESIAVLIITEDLAELCRSRIDALKLSAARPLVVEIPGRHGTKRPADSITRYIRDAIGVKL